MTILNSIVLFTISIPYIHIDFTEYCVYGYPIITVPKKRIYKQIEKTRKKCTDTLATSSYFKSIYIQPMMTISVFFVPLYMPASI